MRPWVVPVDGPHYSNVISTMNSVVSRWNDLSLRDREPRVAPSLSVADQQLAAATSYLSGKVPDRGVPIISLVNKMIF